MDLHYIYEFILTVLRELSRKRVIVVLAFCVTTIAVIVAGLLWPQRYETSATIYVDQRNIIEPLLRGQAEIQGVDPAQEAKDKIYTSQILEKVARDAGLIDDAASSKEIASAIAWLGGGGGIKIRNSGKNYIKVSFMSSNQDVSFNVVNALINAFIRNIAETKRQESQKAFDFIQRQVDVYKEQLKVAEEKLENFNAGNVDGTERSVDARITDLRSQLEELKLKGDELTSRRESIKTQLGNQREYLKVRTESDIYRQRLQEALSRMDTLLISLTETHPDVISLKLQIEDYKAAIIEIEQRESLPGTTNEADIVLNPLYEELRSNLAEVEISLNANTHRIKTISKLLEEEYERSQRLASRRADLSELTRDYNVTKDLYEDMLNRKEKARLSLTLDIEGQGTSYKVFEPPTFPLNPSGLKPLHFLLLAPLVGIFAPIGIVGVFVFLDPRLRLSSDVKIISEAELLSVIPASRNAAIDYQLKKDTIFAAFILLIGLLVSTWLALPVILGAM